jgi:hypothetical protein
MEKKEAISLLKKFYSRYIRNIPFVEGEVNEYILIASIDLCVEEEVYEMAALFKKLLDIGYYDDPESEKSEKVYDYLLQAKKLSNNIEKRGASSEEEFLEKSDTKLYAKAKIKDLENQLLLNDRCINKIKSRLIENPFKEEEKWYPRFEYYRGEALRNYFSDSERINIELDNLYKKIK